ncbi:MAG: response regulator [Acidobacteria bacterium]|nr:response regulator [Acidobacteriota bacterium]
MPLNHPIPILIVDDEADLRDLLVEALTEQGYAAVGADGAAQALALVKDQHFPVIFTDLNMPGGLSGLELLRAVQDRDPRSMGILMTGYATTESAIQALKRGAYDFIQKPFKLVEIEASLARALEHYRLLRENEDYQENLERMVAARTQEILGLKNDIEQLFEGFVNASVTAIEARDPSTSGHSSRVADLTVGLAEAVNGTPNGPYGGLLFNDLQIREIRYASLLHDFGKVGVREQVLVKAKKIEGEHLESIFQRLHQRSLEAMRDRLLDAWSRGLTFDPEALGGILRKQEEETHRLMDLVRRSNEPTVLPQEVALELNDLGAGQCPGHCLGPPRAAQREGLPPPTHGRRHPRAEQAHGRGGRLRCPDRSRPTLQGGRECRAQPGDPRAGGPGEPPGRGSSADLHRGSDL